MNKKIVAKAGGFILNHFLWHVVLLLLAWLFSTSIKIWLIFLYIYLAILAAVIMREIFLFWRRRQIEKYARRAERLIDFLRELIDLAYVYENDPKKFYAKFLQNVTVESLERREIIDPEALIRDHSTENLRREDAELWTLLKLGVTHRELKVIYGLKNMNVVYVKLYRFRNRLGKQAQEALDKEK